MPFQVVRDERGMLHRLKFFFLLLCDTSKMVNFNYLLFARVDARNKLIMRQDTYVTAVFELRVIRYGAVVMQTLVWNVGPAP